MGDGGRQEGRVSRAVVDSPLWEEGSNCHHAVTTIRGWLFHPVNRRIALSYTLVFIDRDGMLIYEPPDGLVRPEKFRMLTRVLDALAAHHHTHASAPSLA